MASDAEWVRDKLRSVLATSDTKIRMVEHGRPGRPGRAPMAS